MSDAEMIARLYLIADRHEQIENSEDRWKNPPYLPQAERNFLRAVAGRLMNFDEIRHVAARGNGPATTGAAEVSGEVKP